MHWNCFHLNCVIISFRLLWVEKALLMSWTSVVNYSCTCLLAYIKSSPVLIIKWEILITLPLDNCCLLHIWSKGLCVFNAMVLTLSVCVCLALQYLSYIQPHIDTEPYSVCLYPSILLLNKLSVSQMTLSLWNLGFCIRTIHPHLNLESVSKAFFMFC